MMVRRWFRPRTCASADAAAEVIARNAAARREANSRFEEQNRRYECALRSPTIDWGPSLASLAKAAAENPTADVRLPLAVDGVPSPETEHAARRRDLRVLYPDEP